LITGKTSFQELEFIGKGGFGTVYRAVMVAEEDFKREVALKILTEAHHDDDEISIRLRDEARILGMISHQCIVQVMGLHRVMGRATLVMEFIPGVDLSLVLRELGALPPRAALEIVRSVAGALHAAYNEPLSQPLHLMHRDIKPANIKITPQGAVKVFDFGIARAEFSGREAKTQKLHFGSLPYMAPERHDGDDYHESDVYSLGAVLFELLLGDRLGRGFSDKSKHETMLSARLPLLQKSLELADDHPLMAFLKRCLAHNPKDRPSAREMDREAYALEQKFEGGILQYWAEEQVRTLASTVAIPKDDPFEGATIVIDSGAVEKANAPGGDTTIVNAKVLFSTNARSRQPTPTVIEPMGLHKVPTPRLPRYETPTRAHQVSRSRVGLWFGGALCLAALAWLFVGGTEDPEKSATTNSGDTPVESTAINETHSTESVGLKTPVIGVDQNPGADGQTAPAPPSTQPDPVPVAPAAAPVPKAKPKPPSALIKSATAPVAVTPAPAPEPAKAWIRYRGSGVVRATARKDGETRRLPAKLEAGTWAVEVDFERGTPWPGSVTIASGSSVVLDCNALRRICSIE
jgi:serine/threonine protein kinase